MKKRASTDDDDGQSQGQDDYDENDITTHAANTSSNDNDNNGMGVARRASPAPSPPPSPRQPDNARRMRLLDDDDDDNDNNDPFGKLKQSSSNETVSTATASYANFSTTSTSSKTIPNSSMVRKLKSRSRNQKKASSRQIKAHQKLVQRKIKILASISGGSIFFFICSFLNFVAFTTLILGASSTTLLFYTIYQFMQSVLNQGEGALFDFLPANLQEYLMNTSLHDAMTDGSSFLENRWYLLYFIPGLTADQQAALVSRLPRRHREMAHGPGGMARMFLPNSAFRLIAPPGAREGGSGGGAADEDGSRMRITEESGHVVSITENDDVLQLPVIEENDDYSDDDENDREITIRDAFAGILDDARHLVNGDGSSIETDDEVGETVIQERQLSSFEEDLHWDDSNDYSNESEYGEVHIPVVHDSDSESSDLGLEITADDFTGGMNEGQLSRLARGIGLRSQEDQQEEKEQDLQESSRASRQQHARRNRNREEGKEQDSPPRTVHATRALGISQALLDLPNVLSLEEEDELTIEREAEGTIINDALNTVINNFSSTATNTVVDTISSAVERFTPSLIRTGTRLSSVAGVGLLGMFTSSQMQPISIMGRSVGGGGRRLGENRTERNIVTGLLSTLVMGGLSIGSAYATRFFTRRYLVAKRSLTNGSTDEDRGKKGSKKAN